MSLQPLLRELASQGSIHAIGECGFDFWEDRPSCMMNETAVRIQTEVFEAQLELALEFSMPIILHLRKAQRFLFSYAKRLAKLPAVILHSWNGPANEAQDFLRHVPNAYFSFGTGLLNGNKKAFATAGIIPLNRILTESDAPWQPPRQEPLPGAKLSREYSSPEDLPRIISFISRARILHGIFLPGFWDEAIDPSVIEETENAVENNFFEVFRA
jgi:TatD DNase family protein